MMYAKIDQTSSGLKTIVAAVDGCKIRVISYLISTDTPTTITWQSNTTALSGSLKINSIIQDGHAGAPAPIGMLGVLETASSESLKLNIVDTAVIGGYLTYVTVAV